VAYEENYIENLAHAAGFSIANRYYGYWCSRPKSQCEDFQDIFILRKIVIQ